MYRARSKMTVKDFPESLPMAGGERERERETERERQKERETVEIA